MNKTKLLTILVLVLAALNLFALFSLFHCNSKNKVHGPKPPMHKEKADAFIQDKFGFDDEQMKQFGVSKEKHHEKSKSLEEDIRKLSLSYYTHFDQEGKDSLLAEVIQANQQLYEVNAKHLSEVRLLCNEEQLKELGSFIENLVFRTRKNGPRPPKRIR